MSDLLQERVLPVRALTRAEIKLLAEQVLGILDPHHVTQLNEIDVLDWIERKLPMHGIHTYPVAAKEIPNCEAATLPAADGTTEIRLREDHFDALVAGGRRARRARATVLHEVGHAVLHMPQLRRMATRLTTHGELLLARRTRESLPAYRDPEWQAWCMAGCIAMPQRAVKAFAEQNVSAIAEAVNLSEAFVRAHTERMKLL